MASGKVTTSEGVYRGTEILYYMKEAVVKIHRKYLYGFEGQSIGSTGWFNIYREFKKIKLSTLEPDLYI